MPASFKARVIRAALCPASRWANIQRTTGTVARSGSSRCAIMLPAGFAASRFHGLLELAVPGSRREFWRGTVDEALAWEPAAFRRTGQRLARSSAP